MKNLKTILIGGISVSLLIISITFANVKYKKTFKVEQKSAAFGQWYIYQSGYPSAFWQAIDPSKYRRMQVWENLNSLCNGTTVVCAIYAESDPYNFGQPDISSGTLIYDRLDDFFSYGVASPGYIRLKDF